MLRKEMQEMVKQITKQYPFRADCVGMNFHHYKLFLSFCYIGKMVQDCISRQTPALLGVER